MLNYIRELPQKRVVSIYSTLSYMHIKEQYVLILRVKFHKYGASFDVKTSCNTGPPIARKGDSGA